MSKYMFNGDPDENGSPRACPEGTVPELRIDIARPLAALFEDSLDVAERRRPRGSSASGSAQSDAVSLERSLVTAPPLVPPPGTSTDECGYAHATSYVYPGASGSANINTADATLSVWAPSVPDDGSHSLMQIWMTSGWNFAPGLLLNCSGATSPGCGGTYPPCVQSLEFGWDVDPKLAQNLGLPGSQTAPHLFTFATTDGYVPADGCYDGIGSSCVPQWVGLPGAAMTAGMVLASSTSTTPQELSIEVQSTSTEWVVYAAMNGTPSAIGYYALSDYSGGLMGSGEAQEFQAGGEVYDKAETTGSGWTIPMGSGADASVGFPGAAYCVGLTACDVASTCFYPYYAVASPTVPSNYDYSFTNIPNGHTYEPYFYVGTGKSTFTWEGGYLGDISPLPAGSTVPPPILHAASFPLTIGANAITVAPRYVYNSTLGEEELRVDVLGINEDYSSGNYQVIGFSSSPSGLVDSWNNRLDSGGSDLYLAGVAADYADGKVWGWSSAPNLWTNDPSGGIVLEATGLWSVTVASPGLMYAVSTTSTCNGSSPKGGCVLGCTSSCVPGSNWSDNTGYGAAQVTLDPVYAPETTPDIYALDGNGRVWKNWSALPDARCGQSGTVTFAQIAAKNGIVFGLGPTYGYVWFYEGGTCWTQVQGGPVYMEAIATDNDPFLGPAVWGVDNGGFLWAAY